VRPRDFIPLAILGGLAAFIVVQGSRVRRDRPRVTRVEQPAANSASAAQTPPPGQTAPSTAGATANARSTDVVALTAAPREPAPVRDLASIQEKIRDGAPGTYILAIIREQQDTIMRWPQRRVDPVRVWIDRQPTVPDFDANYPLVVERVFDEWHEAGFPLRFDFVRDSTQSDIKIRWIAQLEASEDPRIGVTVKTRDQYGWISAADITISTHDRSDGKPLAPELIAGIARHEVGHALGLAHSPNQSDVMFPESRTTVISAVDRATLHLLYILPPGPVK
jgi:predicted Zn-dependent protease